MFSSERLYPHVWTERNDARGGARILPIVQDSPSELSLRAHEAFVNARLAITPGPTHIGRNISDLVVAQLPFKRRHRGPWIVVNQGFRRIGAVKKGIVLRMLFAVVASVFHGLID